MTEFPDGRGQSGIVLGLKANWRQFALLVLINAFVGSEQELLKIVR